MSILFVDLISIDASEPWLQDVVVDFAHHGACPVYVRDANKAVPLGLPRGDEMIPVAGDGYLIRVFESCLYQINEVSRRGWPQGKPFYPLVAFRPSGNGGGTNAVITRPDKSGVTNAIAAGWGLALVQPLPDRLAPIAVKPTWKMGQVELLEHAHDRDRQARETWKDKTPAPIPEPPTRAPR